MAYDVIFNEYQGRMKEIVNTLTLITKNYIYFARCNKQELNFQIVIKRITYYKKFEEYIAIHNNKRRVHDKKWQMYKI